MDVDQDKMHSESPTEKKKIIKSNVILNVLIVIQSFLVKF